MRIAARRPQVGTESPSVAKANGEADSNEDKPKFWRMPPNAELDRAGDWLLANLTAVRAGTIEWEE